MCPGCSKIDGCVQGKESSVTLRLCIANHHRAPRLPGAPAEFNAERPRRYTSFTFFSGKLRTGLPVAAKIAFITAGVDTQMVGSPTPPQKS
jgi:hypothetical protein